MCCAARGYDLLLISLPESQLEKLSKHIATHYGVQVWFLEVDLCEDNNLDQVLTFIDEHHLTIQMLINNAGMGHTRRFEDLSESYLRMQLILNIQVLTQLIHSLIPLMRHSGSGHIINIGSMAGFYALPLKNSYAASKAYVMVLSQALHIELAPYGIGVSVICPNGISSNIHHYNVYRKSGWLGKCCFMDPDAVAHYSIEKSLEGRTIIIPGRFNRFVRFISTLMPAYLKRLLARTYIKPTPSLKSANPKIPQAA
jgi:short-subunit dehydrogenase